MLSLAMHYLNGWAMAAADGAKKEIAEWPPHPDRVFMALAAAFFETDDGDKVAERDALEWLECLPPPALHAPEWEVREIVAHFVPVNDTDISKRMVDKLAQEQRPRLHELKKAGLSQLPEFRSRQPRGFPVAIPHHPRVYLIWQNANPNEAQRTALADLCRKVTNVGHSASLVMAWLEDAPPRANWIPQDTLASARLRVPGVGRLAYLSKHCGRAQANRWADLSGEVGRLRGRLKQATGQLRRNIEAELRPLDESMAQEFPAGAPVPSLDPRLLRPQPHRWQGYAGARPQEKESERGTLFDRNLVVLRLGGHRLSLPATLRLMAAVRNTVMSRCELQPPPQWLSGHTPTGEPSPSPHLAYLPLPFVDAPHADGRIMGVALALPRDLDPDEAQRCLGDFLHDAYGQPRRHRLFDGKWFDCSAELQLHPMPLQKSLDASSWTAPSRRWASVTPVVLDRHFNGKDKWEQAAESVKVACERIGLPQPAEVQLQPVSIFRGVPRSSAFAPLRRKSDGGPMHHSHAVLVFDELVVGPVLIGAGRFRGYGLCRPLPLGDGNE